MPIIGGGGFIRAQGGPFFTNFSDAPQNPISQGGIWLHTPNQWAFIETQTSPNRAVGTQTGTDGFNDSYAYLTGFGPDVQIDATIYKDPTIDTTVGAHEVELLVRVADSGTTVRGYECNWSSNGYYAQIVRWNGPFGDFTTLADQSNGYIPVTGDIMRVRVIGNAITVFMSKLSGGGFQQFASITDNTFSDGHPGIGMWFQISGGGVGPAKFGFTDFSVTEI